MWVNVLMTILIFSKSPQFQYCETVQGKHEL